MWKLRFSHLPQSLVSCSTWSARLTLFIVKKLSTKYPTLNHLFASHSFKLKWCFMKEKKKKAVLLVTQFPRCFSSRQLLSFLQHRKAFGALPIWPQRTLKRCVLKSQGLIQLLTFYCFEKGVLKWNLPCFLTFKWRGGVESVQFSHSVMSNSLWPHESQHARPPCPSPTPGGVE